MTLSVSYRRHARRPGAGYRPFCRKHYWLLHQVWRWCLRPWRPCLASVNGRFACWPRTLGAPALLWSLKAPTADLECLSPQKQDEDVLGLPYKDIDDFLEGKEVSAETAERLMSLYEKTQHKRLPVTTIYDE